MQELSGIFATPLLQARLPDAESANAELRETILQRVAKGPAAQISNIGGWHSTTEMIDPRFPMTMMASPDLHYRAPDGKRYECEVLLRPEGGLILAFPSWLSHAVRPYDGAHKRISIAINLVAVPIYRQRGDMTYPDHENGGLHGNRR